MEKQLSCLPSLLVAGVAKSGTSYLYGLLKQHPELCIPQKETWYFNTPEFTQIAGEDPRRSISDHMVRTEAEYQTLYQSHCEAKTSLEVATGAFYEYAYAIPKILQTLGDIPVFVVLRNPIERAYSAYLHFYKNAWEKRSFEEALASEEGRIKSGMHFMWHYRSMGFYADAVEAYQNAFSRVHFVLFEELVQHPERVANSLCELINVAPIDWQLQTETNASGVPKNRGLQSLVTQDNPLKNMLRPVLRKLPEDLRKQWRQKLKYANLTNAPEMPSNAKTELLQAYLPDIERCERLLHVSLEHWKAL